MNKNSKIIGVLVLPAYLTFYPIQVFFYPNRKIFLLKAVSFYAVIIFFCVDVMLTLCQLNYICNALKSIIIVNNVFSRNGITIFL